MSIIEASKKHIDNASRLIAEFRVEHRLIKGIQSTVNLEQANIEFLEYLEAGFVIYLASINDKHVGIIVCRVEETVVWVELIYVDKDHRRKGVARELYQKAESLAKDLGSETLYNWVLPYNEKMISFLSSMGYDVLNMIELRKPYSDEKMQGKIAVGDNEYRC